MLLETKPWAKKERKSEKKGEEEKGSCVCTAAKPLNVPLIDVNGKKGQKGRQNPLCSVST